MSGAMARKIFRSLALVGIGVALLTTSPQGQTTQASGKLILFADTAMFADANGWQSPVACRIEIITEVP